MKNIIVITGPTAVGKTKLSISLAKQLDAEIINGDAMQVYKNLDIGTAKIKEEEKERILHHLFDIIDINDFYSVYDYQKDCRRKIDEILEKGKKVIIVGGTGLYIKAALYDYQFTEGTTMNKYENLTNDEILAKLKKYSNNIDIHPNNRKRLVRLLNKYENNEEITDNKSKLLYDATFIGLTTEREILYKKINDRVDEMFTDGLLEEVNNLKKHYKTSRAFQTAIGYKEFIPFFENKESLEEVKETIRKNCRHYAKRQYTFFKNQFDIKWFNTDYSNFNNTITEIFKYLKEHN